MSDKNLSCSSKRLPPSSRYYKTTSVYKRYKSEICIIRNAKEEIRAVFGYREIWGKIRCTPLFKQIYLACIFNQLITPGSSFIKYLCCLPSACNFPLLLCCQLNFKTKGLFLCHQKAGSNRYTLWSLSPHRLNSTNGQWVFMQRRCLHEEAKLLSR